MQAQELIPSSIEDKHQQSRHIKRRNKTNLQLHKQHENKRRQKQRIVEQAHKDQSTINLYPANTKEVYPRSRDLESVFWWWEENVYFGFPSKASFGKIPCWDDILPKRGSRRLRPPDACHKGKQWETQVLIHSGKEGEAYSKIKHIEILSWNGQQKKENALGLPSSDRATNRLVVLKGCP